MSNDHSQPRVPLGGDYWQAEPAAPLWGFADLHAHLMAHLAFGGKAFWGLPFDPQGMEHALASCEPVHGGLFNVNPEFGHPAAGGWPEFIVWPRFTTIIHQQAYIDWLYRAYQGGLRLITCLAVNNELLAEKTSPDLPHDDKSAIQAQVDGMKAMVAFVDATSGGAGKGWLQIAYSPEDAQKIIGENRLAVILGVEVDSLGNWHRPEELDRAAGGDPNRARELIGQELDWLYGLGIRQITPIHLADNAFGGTAIYLRLLEAVNHFVSGEGWSVEDAWDTGVRYRVDHDGTDAVDQIQRTAILSGSPKQSTQRPSLIDQIPGVRTLAKSLDVPHVRGGHANARGLNPFGKILLEEMMARGMIIDMDHMSEKSMDQALTLVEAKDYPVICSHAWFRDLLFSAQTEFEPEKHSHYGTSDVHKVAHEAGKRADQIERIGKLGGIVAPILDQGDLEGLRQALPEIAYKVMEPCAGSSTSWAQAYLYAVAKMGGRGVAMGSDINGAASLPGPRFGTFAAYWTKHDQVRTEERRREIDRQRNGVAYDTPIRDYRWHRFEPSGEGGYDYDECNIWQAVAQYQAGFNPETMPHPDTDFPEPGLREAMQVLQVRFEQSWVDHVTEGLWRADQAASVSPEELAEWSKEKRAAYWARKNARTEDLEEDHDTWELIIKIKEVLAKWQEMQGNNPPLTRSTAGARRDFDINLDGVAHYGMLPDLFQDLRNIGLTANDLAPLFRSAYDYVEMWRKCDQRATAIK